MTARIYRFTIGSIGCTVLLDGASLLGIERIVRRFPDATEAEYRQAYAEIGLAIEDADLCFNILVAKVGDQTIMVDAGEAGKPNGGHLLASMQLAGIAPDSITLVVITHTHGDHVLGLLSDANTPVFPNATYVIARHEMAFWQERITTEHADQRPIVAMLEAQGLRLIEMDEQIIPGLTAVPLPGHTPGQIGLVFESEGERLLHLADLLHMRMQFAHPEWSASFDLDTSVSVPIRREALGLAADANMLALFYHLTFPGLGQVKRTGAGFIWEPLAPERT